MTLAQTIGRNLTTAMHNHEKMTYKELADKVGTSQSMISYIAKGEKVPSILLLIKIADALGTTAVKLLAAASEK